MGYFSKRKKYERESLVLKISGIILIILAALTLFFDKIPFVGEIKNYLYQIYLFNVLVFLFALFLRRGSYVVTFFCLLILNYTQISSYANVFLNSQVDGDHHLSVRYEASNPLYINNHSAIILRSGHFNLGNANKADFVTIDKNDNVYTLINVDFTKPEVRAFQALEDFVIKQDEPVVIIGRFGEPAWGKLMKELLQKTGLQVKNRMVLISNSSSFSLFHAPDFYVLGFDNIGISDLETSYNTNTEKPVVMMELSYY